jgi:hypothetical protein
VGQTRTNLKKIWLCHRHRQRHGYLMTRCSLQVVYLWRHVSSTAPPFILWWSNLELLFGPLHHSSPFIGELRCQAIQMEHGLILQREPKTQSILWDVCGQRTYAMQAHFRLLCVRQAASSIYCSWFGRQTNYSFCPHPPLFPCLCNNRGAFTAPFGRRTYSTIYDGDDEFDSSSGNKLIWK